MTQILAERPAPDAPPGTNKVPRKKASKLLIPIVLLSLALGIYPITRGIQTGFTNERVGGTAGLVRTRFNGVTNYRTLFGDDAFVRGLLTILVLGLVIVAATYVLAYLQAMLLNQVFPLRRIVRSIALLPLAVAPVVVGQMFRYAYDPNVGAVNGLLVSLHLQDGGSFLPSSNLGLLWLALPAIWLAVPFATIFLLAAIQGIDQEVVEASVVDGAGPFRRFFSVVLPETRGALAAILPLSFAAQVASFDLYFTVLGGVSGATNANLLIPSIYGYYELSNGLLGRAAATANIILIVILVAFVISRFVNLRERKGSR